MVWHGFNVEWWFKCFGLFWKVLLFSLLTAGHVRDALIRKVFFPLLSCLARVWGVLFSMTWGVKFMGMIAPCLWKHQCDLFESKPSHMVYSRKIHSYFHTSVSTAHTDCVCRLDVSVHRKLWKSSGVFQFERNSYDALDGWFTSSSAVCKHTDKTFSGE